MSIMAWLMWLVLLGNDLLAHGYRYDLPTGEFVAPNGGRVIISCCPAPARPARQPHTGINQ